MRKNGTLSAVAGMSSKRAGALAGRALLLYLLEQILDKGDIDKGFAKKLRYMRKRKYISKSGNSYSLTAKGNEIVCEGRIWSITIPKPRSWDGRWRLVVFDIPKDKRKRRDIFRLRLKELGLTLYQNSVWVYPYPLEREVGQIATFYKLSHNVAFITAEELSGEEILIKRFGL